MVKTPHTRHSRTTKEPVTIDLEPGEVARVKAEAEAGATAKASSAPDRPSETPPEASATDSAGTSAGSGTSKPERATGSNARPDAASPAPDDGLASAFGRSQAAAGEQPRGRGASLAAGVAGGAVVVVLAAALQAAGLLPGASSGNGDTIAAVEARLDELRGEIAALAGSEAVLPELRDRIGAAEQGLASLGSTVETLRGEIAGLGGGASAPPVDLAPLEQRIAAIETAIAGLGGAVAPEAALAAVDEQIGALREEIAAAREAQTSAAGRLDSLETSLADLSARLERQAEAPGTAVIIAASALKAAIDRGGPFMTELETFASLAPDAPEVGELRNLAASGVPTRAQIAAESDAAANAMIAAARTVDPASGLVDRLWSSAMGLVQVRPIGMIEGEGVPEIVARIDAAVTSNDYQRAIDEYAALPDGAKAAGAGFIDKVRARHGADALIDQALAAALKA